MKRKRFRPDDPREWIRRAKSNLALARNVLPDVELEDLCFDAQQAAEKSVKAVFIKRGEKFPFSHDLEKLLRLLVDSFRGEPSSVRNRLWHAVAWRFNPAAYAARLAEKRQIRPCTVYVSETKELTEYAHLTRYPGTTAPVTPREHRRAVRTAAAVLRWAERHIAPP